jgi:hypothetical protein
VDTGATAPRTLPPLHCRARGSRATSPESNYSMKDPGSWRVTHAPYKIISDKFALSMLGRSPSADDSAVENIAYAHFFGQSNLKQRARAHRGSDEVWGIRFPRN